MKAVNLDLKNPKAKLAEDHRSPAEIMDAATAKECEVLAILDELRALVAEPVAA